MKPLSKAAFNFKFASRQRIVAKLYNHKLTGNPDDFIKNGKNGVILRKNK